MELEKQLHKEYADSRVPQSEWFDLTDQEIRNVIQKITSIANTEFLMPEFAQSFIGPHYKIIKVPPYEQAEYGDWRMFGLLILALALGYLLSP